MKYRLIQDTRQLYMWSIATIYLFAFVSLYLQIPGLYGPNGLLPVYNALPSLKENQSFTDHVKSFYSFPSVLVYSDILGMSPEYLMALSCIVGAGLSLSAIVFHTMRCSFIYLLLWLLYLSIHQVGQTFLYFQWDSLLLEAGIITVLVAPFNFKFWRMVVPRVHDGLTFWLVRWLLFRLMFASGVVKLTSQCPTWWGLTALNWHYESQCIPTSLAWYAHQLPEWLQKLSVVGTYYIEIIVPFLFFMPMRSLRVYAFLNQVFFQLCIILTGNYNFFNILTIALCLSLLDDSIISTRKRKVPRDWTRKISKSLFGHCNDLFYGFGKFLVFLSIVGASIGVVIHYFDVKVDLDNYQVLSKIVFTTGEFDMVVKYGVYIAAGVGTVSLAWEILKAIWESLSKNGILAKLWSLSQTCFMGFAVLFMFSISLIPLSQLDHGLLHYIPAEVKDFHSSTVHLDLTNSYGLFRRMTGVGGRPELIIEGANDENGPWMEYEFLYKPGHPFRSPPLVAPHQPRLDWQMWFAALSSYERNSWLVNLIYRLLLGEKDVLELMAPPPFKTPPHYIRVQKYLYHYTKYDKSLSFLNQSGPWWTRHYQNEYIFSLSLDHGGLVDFIKQMKLDRIPSSRCDVQYICPMIDIIRTYSKLLPPTEICLATFTMATVLQFTLMLMYSIVNCSNETSKAPSPVLWAPPNQAHVVAKGRVEEVPSQQHNKEAKKKQMHVTSDEFTVKKPRRRNK